MFVSRPFLRLIRWYNKPGDITKEFSEKTIQFHETCPGLKTTNWYSSKPQKNKMRDKEFLDWILQKQHEDGYLEERVPELTINPFLTNVPLLHPLKTTIPTSILPDFVMFLEGIEVGHWLKMGWIRLGCKDKVNISGWIFKDMRRFLYYLMLSKSTCCIFIWNFVKSICLLAVPVPKLWINL